MIERLNQITLNDFIELSCGNYACLLSGREFVSESTLKEIASKLLIEYRSIVNPSNMKVMVMDKEDMLKERAKLLSLRICQALVSLGFYDDARQVLGQLNVDPQNMSDEQVISKIIYFILQFLSKNGMRRDAVRNIKEIRLLLNKFVLLLMLRLLF
mgnify:CR=1 FL=1